MSDPTSSAFVWVWLPGAVDPVVAGRLDDRGAVTTFTYGRSYLERSDAMALYLPDLPLVTGPQPPRSGVMAGCIADAGPDAWGRRVIEYRRRQSSAELGRLGYLLHSGSDRIGALDFQDRADGYVPREGGVAELDELTDAAGRVERGEPLTPALDLALAHGTSVGGARPKAVIRTSDRRFIAKFESSSDVLPVVKAEFVAMELAARAGLRVAPVRMERSLGTNVLLVERFDRGVDGSRRLMVSALTMLELHDADGMAGRYATYVDLAHTVRARFDSAQDTLRELFARLVFNVLVGNTDDHARNHAAFWDGRALQLTPAYDICPQTRTGGEAVQAMAFGSDGERRSQVARCVDAAEVYHLSREVARNLVVGQIETIRQQWSEVADLARLTVAERERLWGRQFLNPYALEGFEDHVA